MDLVAKLLFILTKSGGCSQKDRVLFDNQHYGSVLTHKQVILDDLPAANRTMAKIHPTEVNCMNVDLLVVIVQGLLKIPKWICVQ